MITKLRNPTYDINVSYSGVSTASGVFVLKAFVLTIDTLSDIGLTDPCERPGGGRRRD